MYVNKFLLVIYLYFSFIFATPMKAELMKLLSCCIIALTCHLLSLSLNPCGRVAQANREARAHSGSIIECYWDKKTGWNFMRVREDKSFPNGLTTAKSESSRLKFES